jgi:hypothetical protein
VDELIQLRTAQATCFWLSKPHAPAAACQPECNVSVGGFPAKVIRGEGGLLQTRYETAEASQT